MTDSASRKKSYRRLTVLVLVVGVCTSGVVYFWQMHNPNTATEVSHTAPRDTLPVGIRRLLKAYPEQLVGATANSLIWQDGTVMPYDDGIANKEYHALLLNPDLEDQMSKRYVKGSDFPDPTENVTDTSRVRYTPFFEKMYGSTREEVWNKLKVIRWLPKTQNLKMQVTTVNGVAQHLQAVSDELDKRPDLLKYVRNPGGTFNWRSIRGTDRRSAHSFGIAVDINIRYADYWLWDRELGRPHKYKNRYPMEIIEIFEKHGFIWGGKWYYYDTMHFEYRPEMLVEVDSLP